MFCPACGQETPDQANFCPSCGQALRTSPDAGPGEAQFRPASPVKYAGFWRRFAALLIDAVVVSIMVVGALTVLSFLGINVEPLKRYKAGMTFGVLFGGTSILGGIIYWLYWAGLESSVFQATLGKAALGLKVTDLKGEPIGFGRASGRYFGKAISVLLFGIGFLMAGWTEKKQALHDIMAGTLVVKKPGSDETP